jgi:GH24 family phage-related lysozyme (muramidase)
MARRDRVIPERTIEAWLGPALDEMTEEQIDRMQQAADRIDDRYPDPDDEQEREAARIAACQYLLGETTIDDARESLLRVRVRAGEALAAAQQIAVMCVADGVSEAEAARRAGIDRMTVRKALGK